MKREVKVQPYQTNAVEYSALREGWDNPNVSVMCMLKHSDSRQRLQR